MGKKMNSLETAYWDLMRAGSNPPSAPAQEAPRNVLDGFGPYVKRPVKVFYNSGDAIRDNGKSNTNSRANKNSSMDER